MLCKRSINAATGRAARPSGAAVAPVPAVTARATRSGTVARAAGEQQAQQASDSALLSKRAVLSAAAASLVLSQASR